MSTKTKNFVKGAAVLGIIGLVVKVIGAVFRIPLANIIDTQGIANYQIVYPTYALLLVISTAGLPTAIAKMVSEKRAVEDYVGAKQIFTVSLRMLLIIGAASTLLLFGLSHILAAAQGVPEASVAYMGIAPALFFVAVISSYRGYFQGMQMMAPTGFSQLVEQLGKLVVGLWLAKSLLHLGPEYGALGALIGVSVSEVLALVLLMIIYRRNKERLEIELEKTNPQAKRDHTKAVLKKLLVIAIPITLGACVMPIVMWIDSAIVVRGLMSIGFAKEAAADKFALLSGYVNPLINMPAVLSLALAMSLVPAISSYKAQNRVKDLQEQSGLGFKIALLVGLPAATGYILLAKPIIQLLYRNLDGAKLAETGTLLIIMSIGVLVLTMLQTMTGILQGLGKVQIPVINLAIGAAVKVVLSFVLIRIPEINVKGAALGTVACYTVAAVLDVIAVVKYSKMRLHFVGYIVKPLACTALMGAVVYFLYPFLYGMTDSNTVSAMGAILAGVVVYAGALLLTRTVTKEEIASIRGKEAKA
ncbi:MAG: polysaccharide biosynthesis protein [Eubacteriales bacterium]